VVGKISVFLKDILI